MSKIDEVRADMVKAMKAKDKDTKETLSMLFLQRWDWMLLPQKIKARS